MKLNYSIQFEEIWALAHEDVAIKVYILTKRPLLATAVINSQMFKPAAEKF